VSINFSLEIISPDKKIYSGTTSEVIIPCFEGLMTILKDHIPLITFLRPGFIEIKDFEDKFYVEEGTIEFSNNNLLILTSSAINLKNLNEKKKDDLIKNAEKEMLKSTISDKEKYILNYKIETLKQIN
tara:strand:- start:55 stop:438 length:384 start_codon:yes stop_codon:yes gene_type:complete